MFVVKCILDPDKVIYLRNIDDYSNDTLKNCVLHSYHRIRSIGYHFSIDFAFTDDIRNAEKFLIKEIAINCSNILSIITSEDFKIERVDYEMF